jgi:lipoate-protein ligase A
MTDTALQLVSGHLVGTAHLNTAVSRSILQRVSTRDIPETLQIGRPHRTVAFGKHDALTDGFDRAVAVAVARGFDPTIRIAGGRAVAFHPQTIRFVWTVPANNPVAGMHERFSTVANHVVATLGSFGVGAVIGEVAGEYCPGAYSVHVEGTGKVMGAGQRLARNAAQVAGVIVVQGAPLVNEVLVPIYAALRLDMDPSLTGAIHDVADVDIEDVGIRFTEQFAHGRTTQHSEIDSDTMALARSFQADHDPRILA